MRSFKLAASFGGARAPRHVSVALGSALRRPCRAPAPARAFSFRSRSRILKSELWSSGAGGVARAAARAFAMTLSASEKC